MNIAQKQTSRQAISPEASPKMAIEIWSDVLCPFCYIGKRRFEEALRHFEHKEMVAVTWKSFQLDPTISQSIPSNYAQYLAERKGMPLRQVEQMTAHVAAMGAEAGLALDFGKAVVANSRDAHRLLHLAHSHGAQNAVKESLLKAHFTEGKDIADTEELVRIGVSSGLAEAEIRTMLAGTDYANDVADDIHEAQHLGIQGVPFFVFNRQYAVSGAQSSDAFAGVLRQSFEEWQEEWQQEVGTANMSETTGEVCTPEGVCA